MQLKDTIDYVIYCFYGNTEILVQLTVAQPWLIYNS